MAEFRWRIWWFRRLLIVAGYGPALYHGAPLVILLLRSHVFGPLVHSFPRNLRESSQPTIYAAIKEMWIEMAVPPEAAGQAAESHGFGGGATAQAANPARQRRNPLRRRLWRRHAVGRDAVHGRVRAGRQRHRHTARFSCRNPRPSGNFGRGQRLSTEFFQQRSFYRRRRAQRAGRDEPRGAQGQPRGSPAQRRPDRRQRSLHRRQSQARRLHLQSAHRPFARQVPGLRGRRDQAHDASRCTASGLNNRAVFRCRNLFVLGMLSWLYQRPVESTDRVHREPVQEDTRRCSTPT